jgi:NAD(P)-dependent dehydrogenase (short-subunit alcohol dehydrogenase family)
VLAYHGANLALVDLNETATQATAQLIQKDFDGIKASVYTCDITNEEAVEALFVNIVKESTAIYGLAHAAVDILAPDVTLKHAEVYVIGHLRRWHRHLAAVVGCIRARTQGQHDRHFLDEQVCSPLLPATE